MRHSKHEKNVHCTVKNTYSNSFFLLSLQNVGICIKTAIFLTSKFCLFFFSFLALTVDVITGVCPLKFPFLVPSTDVTVGVCCFGFLCLAPRDAKVCFCVVFSHVQVSIYSGRADRQTDLDLGPGAVPLAPYTGQIRARRGEVQR